MSGARLLGARVQSPGDFAGQVEFLDLESTCLSGNALGDPTQRQLPVYSPPGTGAADPLPLLFVLPGYTGNGRSWFDVHPWWPGWIHTYDQDVAAGRRRPARLAVPDCMTRLGGSQYVDSPATGAYATHVVDELLPLLFERHPGAADRVGVLGKSSGGFGALRFALQHPGRFQACASISGDCAFDQHYPHEFLNCLRGLTRTGSDPAGFLEAFAEKADLSGDGHAVIYVLACAACYSPNPDSPLGFDLPFDLETGQLIPEIWSRWLAFDPLQRIDEDGAAALRTLRTLWIECGLADEFHLQWGARRLSRLLEAAAVPHEHHEHPGGHRGIDARYLEVVEALAGALTGT